MTNRIVSCKSQKEGDRARKNLSGKYRNTLLGTPPPGNIVILAVFVLLFGCDYFAVVVGGGGGIMVFRDVQRNSGPPPQPLVYPLP